MNECLGVFGEGDHSAVASMATSVMGLPFQLEDFTEEPPAYPAYGECVYVEVPPDRLATFEPLVSG